MLKKRVIISLLLNDGELYRTKQFVPDYVYTQEFVTVDSIDELFIIDITRGGKSEKFGRYVKKIVDKCFIPICVGGHIRTLEDVKWAMGEFGADSVLVNAEAHRNPNFIPEISQKLGSQSITVGIDHTSRYAYITSSVQEPYQFASAYSPIGDGVVLNRPGKCYFDQGVVKTGYLPTTWAKQLEQKGAGQIFLQSIERDGSLQGYDLGILKEVVSAVNIPVVIGGGCGNYNHMKEAFVAGADGCSTSNIYHFPEGTMRSWKLKLQEAGVPVRVE